MTLAEIMVCIAVIAIAVTLVVSFSIMMGDRVQVSRDRLEAQQDLTRIQSAAEGWLIRMTKESATFSFSEDKIIAKVDGTDYTLQFAYGTLTGTLPGTLPGTYADPLTVRTDHITGVSFDIETNGDDTLFFCTVTTDEDKVTFAINPRIGDTVGGSTP